MAEERFKVIRTRLDHADWQDWGMLVLAVWLFVSTWVFPYGETNLPGLGPKEALIIANYPAGAARLLALVLAVLAISGLFRLLKVEKWLALIIGAFIALAPWVLGVYGGEHEVAVANEVVVGLLVCIASLTKAAELPPIVKPV